MTDADAPPLNIRMVEIFTGEVRLRPTADLPDHRRFVFFKNGSIVRSRAEADEIVPIVEIRSLTFNDNGKLVSPDKATSMRIEEVGPEGRPLRFTIMRKDRN